MEIRIRYMDPKTVQKIDELAKEKGVSRQEFLHAQLHQLAVFKEENNREQRLKQLIDRNIQTMAHCYTAIREMNDLLQFEEPGEEV
ncbi:hypothetical protein MUO14_12975 [Halobacillus shinanisalinarum]|uniref:Ribbon-helix-helix protein CopG domain-containing protein n=1 Tax=Halobacillus shinanisalinarum TaxID=2932258 RepID=A0ABY4GTL5_9BACI|nr:hypothetical protein [Halobacillus shinanisalinarum]UOQ91497.1 hypothetical protein MUO14_12975 [Halobacillus shinanisalinarum]